jgi:hypothetical protein
MGAKITNVKVGDKLPQTLTFNEKQDTQCITILLRMNRLTRILYSWYQIIRRRYEP